MTGPVDGPIDARVEWYYDDDWQDVSDDVDMRSEITVTYGRPDEHGEAESTDINMVMRNENAQCAPEDPLGSRFGKIGRGTLMRVRIGDPQPAGSLALPGIAGAYVSTPDVAALDITGDIDVRVDVDPHDWLELAHVIPLAFKYVVDGDQRSWGLYVVDDGILRFTWSTDGTSAGRVTVSSTVGVPITTRRLAVRATLDVNNGAAGNTVTFYTADTIAGPWAQLGDPVITSGVTSIFASTALVEVGSADVGGNPFVGSSGSFSGLPLNGSVYAFELRNGIGGSIVATPDFTAQAAGATSFTDTAGRTWTVHGSAQLVVRDPSIRGTAAAVSWTPGWDETGYDAQMAVRGAGILERLGHGQEPLRSPLTYDLSTAATTIAYWPLEDGSAATTAAAAVGGQPLTVTGDVTMAAYNGFAGSAAVPTFGNIAHISGSVPAYVPELRQRVACMLHQSDSQPADRNLLFLTCTGGSVADATLVLKSDGSLRIVMRDSSGATLLDSAGGVGDLRGENAMVWMLFEQNGANIDWQIGKIAEGEIGVMFHDGTLNSQTYGRFTTITVGAAGDLAGAAIGHVHIVNGDDSDGFWVTSFNSLIAWAGERTAHRIARLSHQESVPCLVDGDALDTEQVGPQGIDQLLTILDAAAAVDAGPWGERRDAYSLLYRTRESVYRQGPALTLDMADGTITTSLRPPLDTQSVRNDVTVTRDNGSSYRAIQRTGPLSVQNPPNGIGGSYPANPPLNLHSDSQVANQATWRLHLGTTPGHRVSHLEIEMHYHPELVQAVLELRNGDVVRVLNTPRGLPPGPLDLIVLGTSDRITDQEWHVVLNCAPGAPWRVAAVSDGADEERGDTGGTEVAVDFVAGADTSLRVVSVPGVLWTEDPAEYPLEIQASGAVLSATAAVTTELAPNGGGFETDAAGWEPLGGTVARSTAQAHSGVASLLLTPDGATAVVRARTADVIRVYERRRYTFAVWVYSDSGYTVDISVRFWDDDAGAGAVVEFEMWANEAIPAGVWTLLSATRTAPVGARSAELNVNQRTTPAATDLLYIDDVTFTGPEQTFTVTQAPVNGVAKTIPAGTDVRLAVPPTIGL